MLENEGFSAEDEIREEIVSWAQKLLVGIVNLQDSLTLIVENNDAAEEEVRNALTHANETLSIFNDSYPEVVAVRPRRISIKDRGRMLQGQHGGVTVEYSVKGGAKLKVNFYGGMRIPATSDMKDTDIYQRASHAARTRDVASQPTNVNWHLSLLGDEDGPRVDAWLEYIPGSKESFRQSALLVGGERVDVISSLGKEGYKFDEIKESVLSPIVRLTELVPSSV